MRHAGITGLVWLGTLVLASAQGVLIVPDETPPDHRIRDGRPFRIMEQNGARHHSG
jgi:hypothetical protein